MVQEEKPLDHRDDFHPLDDDRISHERAILRRAAEEIANRRAQAQRKTLVAPPTFGEEDSFVLIAKSLEDTSPDVRNATARRLFSLDPPRATSFFNRVLLDTGPDRRHEIGAVLAGSGLAADALDLVTSNVAEQSYQAFAILFLLAKAGEIKPLMGVIEAHLRTDLRVALIKLLELSGKNDVLPAFQKLTESPRLPDEVRNEMIGAIGRIGDQCPS